MSTEILKSQINLDHPDERDVLRLIFQGVGSSTPRGFSDVFTAEEIFKMWSSDDIMNWTQANRDWLTLAAADIISP